jgi:tRNA nucleotidyltransferase/poly(A) polymerase
MARTGLWAVLLVLIASTPLHAQKSEALNDIKAKVWEAQLVQRNFAAGLRHCDELNGTNFYFETRDRVLNLQDYRRSLDNLAAQGAYNPETRRPWSKQDADARWAQVQKDAVTHQANCAAVASLPFLEKKMKELEQQSGAPVDSAAK